MSVTVSVTVTVTVAVWHAAHHRHTSSTHVTDLSRTRPYTRSLARTSFHTLARASHLAQAPRKALTMSDREMIVRWEDPAEALAQLPHLDGIDYLRKMQAGEIPGAPIAGHVAMELTEVAEGAVTFTSTPDESHYNPIGMVHGGLVCTLLDSALGCAAQTLLPAGTGYTSIEIHVNYLRPVTSQSAPLTCVGRVVKPGRRVTFAEGEVRDARGNTVATATGSLLIFPIDGSPAAAS